MTIHGEGEEYCRRVTFIRRAADRLSSLSNRFATWRPSLHRHCSRHRSTTHYYAVIVAYGAPAHAVVHRRHVHTVVVITSFVTSGERYR
jgi:hypothetical protein